MPLTGWGGRFQYSLLGGDGASVVIGADAAGLSNKGKEHAMA